jgi:hypothetical protein
MTHEVVEAFRAKGLQLRRTLEEMFNELPVHRTERRGCGFTQATRFLSVYINGPGDSSDPIDLDVFHDWPSRETRFAASSLLASGWIHGWRRLDELSAERLSSIPQYGELVLTLARLRGAIRDVINALSLQESRLAAHLLAQVLARDGEAAHQLPPMPVKPEIGSCSQAEEFFLELAHGRVRRGGIVNVFADENNRPLLVEKMNLGESHSAIVLEPLRLNGVDLPPGSLCALAHVPDAPSSRSAHGLRFPFAAIGEARFLRLTTLAVEPGDRKRAFSSQLDAQVRGNMLSPTSTRLADLREFATREAQGAS